MTPAQRVDEVIQRVADGDAVDWDGLETSEAPGLDVPTLQALRILEEIAQAHRETPDPALPVTLDRSMDGPTRWGKYLLTGRIGSGSFGEVFCAWDSSLQREVAIKLLHPLPGADLIRQRLLDEGRRLAEIHHSNVVWVLEVEEHGGRLGLCMEFIRGRTLHDVVRLEGRLGAPEALRIGIAVCSALEAVHAKSLVHRDIKPNNVMRDESGRIVLMDFGSGIRVREKGNHHRTSVGTPLYMAPELFEGAPPSPASDIYSVGVLLYFLVSGRHPVEGRSIEEIRRQHASGSVRPVSEVAPNLPQGFVELLNRALNPDPDERIGTAAALRQELDCVLRALTRQRSARQAALAAATAGAGVIALFLLAGYVTTTTYHYLLGITPQFATENALDHLVWGVRSFVAPVAMAAFVSGLTYLALECWGLALKVSGPCRTLRQRIVRRTQRFSVTVQIGLRDWAVIAFLSSVAFLVAVPLILFPRFVDALLAEPLASAPSETLRLLGAPGAEVQDAYRQGLSVAMTVMSVAWMALWRSARRSGVSLGPAGWLGLGCVLVTLVLLSVPFRVVYHTEEVEKATYAGTNCHVTGMAGDTFLLFCPDRLPRVFSVNGADPAFVREGTVGKLFENVR